MKYFKIIFFVSILVFVSCKKDNGGSDVDFGYDYIVDEIGSYTIYQVDSTIYNDFTGEITHHSLQFKDKVVEEFKDNLGRVAHRVVRYYKDSADTDWVLGRSYYIVKGDRFAEKVEENLRFINFVFPPKLNTVWDGNKYIEGVDNNQFLSNWDYQFTSVDEPATIENKEYPMTASILLRDKQNQIEKVYAKEIYARGVGLVYKEWWHLETQKNFELPWPDKAEKGYIVVMQAIENGVE